MPLFSVSLFFVVLRESLEVGIIVSVLLAAISKIDLDTKTASLFKKMVWLGTLSSAIVVCAAGAALISVWYRFGSNLFEQNEDLFEGIFGILASVFVFATAIAFLCGDQLHANMSKKLNVHLQASQASKSPHYGQVERSQDTTITENNVLVLQEDKGVSAPQMFQTSLVFFWVPFLTVLREGFETILLIGGVSFSEAPSSIPLAAIAGVLVGALVSFLIHRASGKLSLRWFFGLSCYVLLLLAAGIFSRSIGKLEDGRWYKAASIDDEGDSLGFDPRTNVWNLACCNEHTSPGFGLMYSLLGYRSIATVGTIVSYCMFWLTATCIIVGLKYRRTSETSSVLV